jgi:hypothetical protein
MLTACARTAGVFILLCLIGCSPRDPFNRQPVSGTVTLNGKPVKSGQIFFEPAAGQQVATNSTITDGRFQMTREEGLSPGNYHWKLLVLEGAMAVNPEGGDAAGYGATPKNAVPAKANGGVFEVKEVRGTDGTKLDIAIP